MADGANLASRAPAKGAFRLDGRTAVVTGAGAGIGREIALAFARAGANLVVNDIAPESVSQLAELIGEDFDIEAVSHGGDATRPEGAGELMSLAAERFGPVDVLVNNAAAFVELKQYVDMDEEDLIAAMSSFYATHHCTRAVLPAMLSRRYGRIVNITSLGGEVGGVEMSLYSSAKGAIHALSRSIAKEVASQGVTVNCVAPGTVDTPRQRLRPESTRREREARIPVGRFATGQEIAHAALFLALEESAYITGEILFVDGGRP